MDEIWRAVLGFEGFYEVSNWGRVRSLTRELEDKNGNKKVIRGRILKPGFTGAGYLGVPFSKKCKRYLCSIHRLVAMAFIPNPFNLPEVNHKDENKKNNFVFVNEDGSLNSEKSNLEWVSHKYNMNYGSRLERALQKMKGKPRQRRKNIRK